MNVTILYFASLREAVGIDRESVELPAHVDTIDTLRAWLRERGPAWAAALDEDRALRAAVDRAMAAPGAAIRAGAEIAFFPPVTGG